jgi:ParB family chromosome partitioning protein
LVIFLTEPTHLSNIPPDQIIRNQFNPRLKFDEKKIKILKDSIAKNNVLVPITVFWDSEKEKYRLIDGERRWRCSKELGLETIPAVVIPEPDAETNLLRMFSIHHLREQWSLIATALKLEQLMDMTKTEDTKQLSTLTGMSTVKVNHCKRILSYPKKYQDIISTV